MSIPVDGQTVYCRVPSNTCRIALKMCMYLFSEEVISLDILPFDLCIMCINCSYRRILYRKTIVVSTRLKANSVAYTSYTLPLHSDLPYYEAKPGVC